MSRCEVKVTKQNKKVKVAREIEGKGHQRVQVCSKPE